MASSFEHPANAPAPIALTLSGNSILAIFTQLANEYAPSEVVSKADIYEAYLGYKAFIKDIK